MSELHQRKTHVAAASPRSTYDSYYGGPSQRAPGYNGLGSNTRSSSTGSFQGSYAAGNHASSSASLSTSSYTHTKMKKRHSDGKTGNSTTLVYFLGFLLFLSWACGIGYMVYCKSSYNDLSQQMQTAKRDLEAQKRTATNDVRNIQTQLDRKVRELNKLQEDYQRNLKSNQDNTNTNTDKDKADKVEKALRKQLQNMKDKISRESRRGVEERFGVGPHKVRVEVRTEQMQRGYFVIELFSEKMPHAVHLFLEQVVHGLWNGCSFVINAGHILQAGAHPFDTPIGSDDQTKLEGFRALYLDTLAFPEYHPDHPHLKWTVGFAGRPSGPDFYVNKMDNSKNHGPGGQMHHDLSEEADPCFGKIISGFDVMEQLFNSPVDGSYDLLQKPIQIVEMALMDYDPRKIRENQVTAIHENGSQGKSNINTNREAGGQPLVDGHHRPNLHEIHHDMNIQNQQPERRSETSEQRRDKRHDFPRNQT